MPSRAEFVAEQRKRIEKEIENCGEEQRDGSFQKQKEAENERKEAEDSAWKTVQENFHSMDELESFRRDYNLAYPQGTTAEFYSESSSTALSALSTALSALTTRFGLASKSENYREAYLHAWADFVRQVLPEV